MAMVMQEWDDLDALVAGFAAANEAWRTSSEALNKQLDSFDEIRAQIDRHFNELAVYESLLALSRRALIDAASVHTARLNYGLMRSAAMVWHAGDDPRTELAQASPEGSYSVEVQVGPRYLLGAERDAAAAGDQRLSVLIGGEKQLVATLPTTPDKFRAALLRAFERPHRSGPPHSTESADAAAPEEAAASAPDNADSEAAAAGGGEAPANAATPEAIADKSEPLPPSAGTPRKRSRAKRAPKNAPAGPDRSRQTGDESVIELPGPSAARVS